MSRVATVGKKVAEFHQLLFEWHKTHYRDMPWRDTRDPYRILVSEIMLQQTQVARVTGKYAEFLKKFPTVKKLAAAPLGEVLKVWSGLGYNRRAKFLQLCAKEVIAKHDGKIPCTFAELVKLPGIGISTAGALLAFSFGQETPMIDTNIRRILVRVFFKKKIPTDKELYAFASSIIPKGKGREWNYAMLDLGASLCTARNHSDKCPLQKLHAKVGDFVYKKLQKKFAGSDRFYRGKLLKFLTQWGNASHAEIMKQLSEYKGNKTQIVERLLKEGMIVKNALKYKLPQ